MPEDMPDRMPEDMPDRMPEDMSDRMPEDLPVTKCINVMVGITRSKVIVARGHFSHLKLGLFSINGLVELSLIHFTSVSQCLPLFTIVYLEISLNVCHCHLTSHQSPSARNQHPHS